ncbi:MAG: hydrolase [bacterium]|nr:hydrolase [bacterium]
MIEVLIDDGSRQFYPVVLGNATWSLERQGVPGKFEFLVLVDSNYPIQEGNRVCVFWNGTAFFYGFVFERKWSKDKEMKITAYDQLRYLKNKDTYVYKNKTADGVIRMIAEDFGLSVGELASTEFVIASRSESDKTLFDIILTALDLTMVSTRKMYVLYDSYGKLTLTSIADMKLNVAIFPDTAEDYDCSSSIDGDTYNQVKVSIDNEDSGKREIYIAKHSENINAWGVLQYYYQADKGVNGQATADSLLLQYNRKTKKLSVKNALGDVGVRAGCLIPVFLDLEDESLKNYMMVEKVTHTWEGEKYTMNLDLRGRDWIA